MIVASDSLRMVVPRASRMNRLLRRRIMWRLPAWLAFTFPVAVKLKRFFAPLFVFILGIVLLLKCARLVLLNSPWRAASRAHGWLGLLTSRGCSAIHTVWVAVGAKANAIRPAPAPFMGMGYISGWIRKARAVFLRAEAAAL